MSSSDAGRSRRISHSAAGQCRGGNSRCVAFAAIAAGLSAEAVLEVVLECAFASLVGLIDNIAGHVELDAFLEPQAWSPAA